MSSVTPKLMKEVGIKFPGMTRVLAFARTSLWHDKDPPH